MMLSESDSKYVKGMSQAETLSDKHSLLKIHLKNNPIKKIAATVLNNKKHF